jgi:hypothetical protein
MREAILGSSFDHADVQQMREVAVEGDLSQANDNPNAWEGSYLCGKVGRAVSDLAR